jgi:hypothetical protein
MLTVVEMSQRLPLFLDLVLHVYSALMISKYFSICQDPILPR